MNADDWKKVETALQGSFGRAVLVVDGYKLTLEVQQAKPLKYVIAVFVDGWMKGEWLMKDCEERRRFCCPKATAVHSPASKAKLTKGLGKRAIAKYFPDLDKKFTWYSSAWSNFAGLKRHLVKNNQSIELQECFP
jgi:hypothetical protein